MLPTENYTQMLLLLFHSRTYKIFSVDLFLHNIRMTLKRSGWSQTVPHYFICWTKQTFIFCAGNILNLSSSGRPEGIYIWGWVQSPFSCPTITFWKCHWNPVKFILSMSQWPCFVYWLHEETTGQLLLLADCVKKQNGIR